MIDEMITTRLRAEGEASVEHDLLDRIQSYLRWNAAQRSIAIASPPLTLFLHPSDDSIALNYAMFDHVPDPKELPSTLASVSQEFAAHDRACSLQFVGEIPRQLASALHAQGFTEHTRERVMVCTRDVFRSIPPASDVTVVTLDSSSALDLVRESLRTNERGFDQAFQCHVTDGEEETYRARLVEARAFLAYLKGEPAGAGMFDPPVGGVTELSGITTVEPFRQRGVATALTTCAVSAAFSQKIDVVFLITMNEDAQRVYQRIGFRDVGSKILFVQVPQIDPATRP
jgi:predicted GNAT family acetyltransferase